MDFKKLFEIYGDELPSMLEFLYDGKHNITLRMIAKHYGVRRGYLVWGKFVKDFALYVMKRKAESAGKDSSETVLDKVEDVVGDAIDKVEEVVTVANEVADTVDSVLDLFKKDDEDDSASK